MRRLAVLVIVAAGCGGNASMGEGASGVSTAGSGGLSGASNEPNPGIAGQNAGGSGGAIDGGSSVGGFGGAWCNAGAGGGFGGSSVGGGAATCAWSTPPDSQPSACGSWFGGSLAGVSGPTSCPCPSDPAVLTYGQTVLTPCQHVTGPVDAKYENGILVGCQYHYDETTCGGASTDWWLDIPAFGGGLGKLSVPTLTVSAALAKCSEPTGPVMNLSKASESAPLLVGSWAVCQPSEASFVNSAAGVTFHPDGSFELLLKGSEDQFVPSATCNELGLWGFWPPELSYELLVFGDAGTWYENATFHSGSPQFVELTGAKLVKID